jgi:hypothetical protein
MPMCLAGIFAAARASAAMQTASPKSDLFRDLLPLLNSRHITLPQHNRLIAQIVGLERRVSRAGKDSIAHASQGQDDLVNAVAGCAAALHKKFYDPFNDDDPDGRAEQFTGRRLLPWGGMPLIIGE